MERVLFCRIGSMKYYQGVRDNDSINGGGSYNDSNIGHEQFNFKSRDGVICGFVQPAGDKINLQKIDNTVNNVKTIDNILVIFVSKNVIIGYYKQATIYRNIQNKAVHLDKKKGYCYNIKTNKNNAVLLSSDARTYEIPRGKGAMGQSNICYAYDDKFNLKSDTLWIQKAINYVRINKLVKSYIQSIVAYCEKNIDELPELVDENFEITPLLIIHFLQVVKTIVAKGLKKNYYSVEKKLNAKIKGRISITDTLKRNIFQGQKHKTVCHYQEFGLDCIENRLLKKVLKFVNSYLAKSKISTGQNLQQVLNYCLAPFVSVSDNIDISAIKSFNNNVFFKEYNEAIRLGKMILKRFAYNIQNANNKQPTPPFWIDMAILFEIYILLDNNKVAYQPHGNYGKPDFLIDDIIVDTKYKTDYYRTYVINDIRQLSAYGRDKKIRKKLQLNEQIAKCLIIYPNKTADKKLPTNLWDDSEPITEFIEFKKLAIKLPEYQQNH